MSDSKHEKPLSLAEFINWVKRDLLSNQLDEDDPAPFFIIDEVMVEVNFVVTGSLKGGFSFLKVVEAGSEVSEDRVQKATVRLRPIVSYDEIVEELKLKDPGKYEEIKRDGVTNAAKFFLRGKTIDNQDDTPQR